MQSNIPVSILAGCGMWCLYTPIKDKCSNVGTVVYYLLGVGALLMGAYQIVSSKCVYQTFYQTFNLFI